MDTTATNEAHSSPPLMSATLRDLTGEDFAFSLNSATPPAPTVGSPPSRLQPPHPEAPRAVSQSPSRKPPAMSLNQPTHTLNNAKSTPALAMRPAGSVRNMATKFDRAGAANGAPPPQLRVEVNNGRISRSGARSPTKSPTKRLQKQRPAKPRSPTKSPRKTPSKTSFETNNSSFSSNATLNSRSDSSQKVGSPKAPYVSARPLFGEIRDGKWNGNFPLGEYALPTFTNAPRRSSESGMALGHGRSASHQDILQPASATTPQPMYQQPLNHRRSRSAIDGYQAPSLPNLSEMPGGYPTPPASGTRQGVRKDSTSRIPVSNRRQSLDSPTSSLPHSRSASAMSNTPSRNRLAKSPVEASPRQARASSIENGKPTAIPTRSRYDPPAAQQNGQKLSAKIVAPATSPNPPLRSSRPRQPVSMATTSASRARAAERFPHQTPKDGRRPSEQWLGKPYDPQKERSRRKIPELKNIDFAERKERVMRALSQNLEPQHDDEPAQLQRSRKASLSRASQSSRQSSMSREVQSAPGAQQPMDTPPIQDMMPGGWPTPGTGRNRGLSLDTTQVPTPAQREPEPSTADTSRTAETTATAATEFEVEESPVLGRPITQEQSQVNGTSEPQYLLSSATYQPPSRAVPPFSPVREAPGEEVQSPRTHDSARHLQQPSPSLASRSGTEFGDESMPASADESPSDIEERWGLEHQDLNRQESIRIMLDNQLHDWNQPQQSHADGALARSRQYNQDAFASNGFSESPVQDQRPDFPEHPEQDTPRKNTARDETLKPNLHSLATYAATSNQIERTDSMSQGLQEYLSTGQMDEQMAERIRNHLEGHFVDISRASANEGSDGFMIGELLAGLGKGLGSQANESQKQGHLQAPQYEIPAVTPDTPPGWREGEGAGEAIIYSNEPEEEELDFQEQIRRANETYERAQRGDDQMFAAESYEDKPPPPPKDVGYRPRSSMENRSNHLSPDLAKGLRISTTGGLDLPEIHSAGERAGAHASDPGLVSSPTSTNAPPQPAYAPPPPPPSSSSASKPSLGMSEITPVRGSYSERGSSELSPRMRRTFFAQSGSSRPSTDSQRVPPPLPGSTSMSSFADSTRQTSLDTASDSQTKIPKAPSPSPEQKKLTKFWYIIKELLDTENVYHQDVKIVVDIYKPTAMVPDLLSAEDKKILFGNLEEIENFTLWFYDQLRKAVSSFYMPAKTGRWANKRGSFSTTQSDGTNAPAGAPPENLDPEKANTTTIGQTFTNSLPRMEKVYKEYLKNHDAANQRLLALRGIPTIKAWLDECHANAADITSAWDLNSLLVKPTQRIQKYPLLLKELLDNSPEDHPDRNASLDAMNGVISVLERINSEKKRADLINDLVNGKRKDSDVKSGLARAFGRRTERIKEKVGVVEEFKDPDFDGLAHKMAGHYIRLQIVMRDFQDNVARTDKWMELMISFASGLDLYTDVHASSLPELESKWRKYGMAIREISNVIYPGHRAAMQKRVIDPLIECLKLHARPQAMIAKRKKRIVDYARCHGMEKRGEKPDKKTIEASETYVALNDQLKIELPKLYDLTGQLSRNVLRCFLQIQEQWFNTWQRKMMPILDEPDLPQLINEIEPAFHADYEIIVAETDKLGICNGAALADIANFLSPQTTFTGDPESSSSKRPPTTDSSKRTMSAGSDTLPTPGSSAYRRRSSGYTGGETILMASDQRIRSNSSLSNRGMPLQTPASAMPVSRPWSNANTPNASLTPSRPATANPPSSEHHTQYTPRPSTEQASPAPSPRLDADATYFSANPARNPQPEPQRFSGNFSSATPTEPTHPPGTCPPGTPVVFVCASLFEFSIDRTRREAGYPYLTYVQGEVFDVVGQKGELWLAKNQDDASNTLGWIWEQHFVVLSEG